VNIEDLLLWFKFKVSNTRKAKKVLRVYLLDEGFVTFDRNCVSERLRLELNGVSTGCVFFVILCHWQQYCQCFEEILLGSAVYVTDFWLWLFQQLCNYFDYLISLLLVSHFEVLACIQPVRLHGYVTSN
jgi:hypothetical protein